MRVVNEPAYVLHHRSYSETSLLLELWTASYGRVAAIAKGAKRQTGKRGNPYVLFREIIVSWSGKGELMFINKAEVPSSASLPEGEALLCGMYMNELIMYMFHRDDPHPKMYKEYQTALSGLGEQGSESVLRRFEKNVLTESGYGLVLDHEANTRELLDPDAYYDYYPEQGPVRVLSDAARGLDSVRMRGQSLLDLNADKFEDESSMREIKSLIRSVLSVRLQGRTIKSREMFLKMKSFKHEKSVNI